MKIVIVSEFLITHTSDAETLGKLVKKLPQQEADLFTMVLFKKQSEIVVSVSCFWQYTSVRLGETIIKFYEQRKKTGSAAAA